MADIEREGGGRWLAGLPWGRKAVVRPRRERSFGGGGGETSRSRWRWRAAAVFALGLIAGGVFVLSGQSRQESTEKARAPGWLANQGGILERLPESPRANYSLLSEDPWFRAPDIRYQAYTISPNDVLSSCLNEMGVPYSTIMEWYSLSKDIYNLSRVKPGQSLALWTNSRNQILRFEFNISSREQLVITRTEGDYKAERVTLSPSELEADIWSEIPVPAWVDPRNGYHYYRGVIHNNFYTSAINAGMTPATTMLVIRIFSHLDFSRRLRQGDRFSVMTAGGDNPWEEGPILAAMIEVKGKPYYMFRFEEGESFGYYDEKGRSTRKTSFICPIRYRRISSVFTYRRFHPVLHTYRPHLGVDFAAPEGTPIYAAADGYVKSLGYNGGYGKSILLVHNNNVQTMYNHLASYAAGLKKGKSVKQGQIIGYCGSTGLSTGPHLDYRVFINGKPVNPLNITSMAGEPVKDKRKFKEVSSRLRAELERELPLGPPRPWGLMPPEEKSPRAFSADADVYGDY